MGSRVRIRVGGRRLRGFVTALIPPPKGKDLLPLDGVVGTVPSFTEADLDLLRTLAKYYVTPLSTVLDRTVPPNVPRPKSAAAPNAGDGFTVTSIESAAPHQAAVLDCLGDAPQGGTMIVVPSMSEATRLAEVLTDRFSDRVAVAHSGLAAKDTTKAWVHAVSTPDAILVGTREIVLWPMPAIQRLVVVEDSRRVMKSPSTPTFGVREIAIARAQARSIPLDVVSPLPSLEVQVRATTVVSPAGRSWGLVEVVDRTESPPTSASVLERTRTAVAATVRKGERCFVLVPRRGFAKAVRCVACSHVRICPNCGAAGSPADACLRCGGTLGSCTSCGGTRWRAVGAGIGSVIEELRTIVGRDVGDASANRLVSVGTERDLVGRDPVALAVAVEIDSVALAPTYRSAEDALRLLARLSHLVSRGRGRRTIIQTSHVQQPVVEAMQSGHWQDFMKEQAVLRRRAGFPPAGELVAIEVGGAASDADQMIRDASAAATVLGPADLEDRERWLVQGRDLSQAKIELRPVVRTLRDQGHRVRVDVDPIDL